jgi:streptogramin lyase
MTLHRLRFVARPAVVLVALAAAVSLPSVNTLAATGDITEYPVPTPAPTAVTAGPDGNLWVTEASIGLGSTVPDQLARVTTGGSFTEYPFPTVHSTPSGIAKGPDGNLWITEHDHGVIDKATTSGVFTQYSIPTVGAGPLGIVAGPDGNMWFTEGTANKVANVTTSGVFTEYAIPTVGGTPVGIAVGSDGNLWFTEVNANNVARVTTAGVITEFPVPTASAGPDGIALGSDGNVWFTEASAGNVAKVTTAGVVTEYPVPTANSAPEGIALGSDGNIWFTEASANKVARVTTSGVVTEFAIPTGSSNAAFMAAGPDGNVWFTETVGNKVAKVAVAVAPTVTTQPSDQTVTVGAAATFTSAALGTPAPTMQWQISTGGGPFADVVNGTSATLTVPSTTLAMSGNKYRAVFTNVAGSVTSNTATLTVNKASPTIATQATPTALTRGAISDTATLSGGITPSGTITFDVFDPSNPTCSGTSTFQSIKPVSGDGVYQSDPFPAVLAGTYNWVASYSGDANNNAVATACNDANETSLVTKASPTITTTTVSPVNLGDRISDTATLSGGNSPTGAFNFTLYRDDPTCAGVGVFTSIITTINGNGSYQSDQYTLPVPGSYSWVVFYGGDANNNPATTACNGPSETVVVSKAITFITTSATPSAITTGAMLDTATLSGGYLPTGTITFTLYGPDDTTCVGTPAFTWTTPVLIGNADYPSGVFSPVLAGAYRWVAAYSGDGSNSAVTTSCNDAGERTTVTKMSTTLSTFATASVQLGGPIGDVATLSGGNSPTGTITFTLFGPNNSTCSGTPLLTSSQVVSGSGRYPSDSFTPIRPGDYRWVASYSGDANNYSSATSCDDFNETSTVSKARPTITTQATISANAGGPISDTAILAGGFGPTGAITFSLFGPNDTTCSGSPISTSIKTVGGDGSYPSDPFTAASAGTYSWMASYGGDAFNFAAATVCGDPAETSIVTKANPTITTQATVSASAGGAISDTAILAGGNAATGGIAFAVFGPDSACAGIPVFTWTTAVSGDGSYSSGTFSPLLPGAYSWIAAYSGDTGNNAATTACNDVGETSTVTKASPTITTHATPSASTGGAISDTAALAGGSVPTGTITFNLYGPNDSTCAGPVLSTTTKVISGDGSYTSDPFSPTLAGAYSWVASYSGDVSNSATSTACNDANETTTVTRSGPTITTSATPSANTGGAISDTAILAGGNAPTGTITITLFGPNSGACSGSPIFTWTTAVSGDGSYSSGTFTPLLPGAYSWIAAYSGDAGNSAATTACNDPGETSTVNSSSPTITTKATVSASTGGAVLDAATLAGGSAPTGTITFSLFGPNNPTCLGTPIFSSTKTVSGDGGYPSDPFSPLLPGAYSWIASYSGDAGNNAASTACNDANETSTVTKANPALTTQATVSAKAGDAISDTATLAGGSAPTGTITFSLFGPSSTICSGPALFTSIKTVSGNGIYPSDPFGTTQPGAYSWIAAYSGDAGNSATSTACNDAGETSTVAKASPTLTTQATVSANAGGPISDTAILGGGIAPTGAITFSLFGPNNAVCSGTPIFTSLKTVGGDGSYPSDLFSAAAAGTYSWVASYGGDANNNGAATACNDPGETSSVTKASPKMTSQATVSANTGGAISDTAILAGGNAPTGTITFTLFGPNNPTCSGNPLFTWTTTVGSGNGSYPSGIYSPLLPGAYSWVASYSGDAGNNSTSTACNDLGETSTVTSATPTITTSATASANTGGAISDTATLAGGSLPTGTVTFSLFGPNNASCSGAPVFTSTKTVNGDGSYPSDPFSPTMPGTYSWVAGYGGDAGNNAVTTACNDAGETSTVTAASSQDVKVSMFRVDEFRTGQLGAFIVIVTNTGAQDTSGTLTFTDVLPAGLTYVHSFTFDGWACGAVGQTVTCTYTASLPAQGVTTFALFVKVTASANTVLANVGTITPTDATPDDNTASVTLTVGSRDEDDEDSWSHDNNNSQEVGGSQY